MIDGLKRGKWVAGRTVGLTMKVAPRQRALTDDEWLLLGEEVERCANQAVDEAVHATLEAVAKYLEEGAAVCDAHAAAGQAPEAGRYLAASGIALRERAKHVRAMGDA